MKNDQMIEVNALWLEWLYVSAERELQRLELEGDNYRVTYLRQAIAHARQQFEDWKG